MQGWDALLWALWAFAGNGGVLNFPASGFPPRCLCEQSSHLSLWSDPDWSLHTSDPQSSLALQDKHMLISGFSFPNPKYFPSNSAFQPHFQSLLSSMTSLTFPPASFSPLCCIQIAILTFLLPGSAPCSSPFQHYLLPVSHKPSLQPISYWGLFLHPFSHTPPHWHTLPLKFPGLLCSSFTLCAPSPAGYHIFIVSISSLTSSLQDKTQLISLVLQDIHAKNILWTL